MWHRCALSLFPFFFVGAAGPLTALTPVDVELQRAAGRYQECVVRLYPLEDPNPIHDTTTRRIVADFLKLLSDYPKLSQRQLDRRAEHFLRLLYRDVELGSLEDSQDARRQTYRAVTIFLALALCSDYNAHYWLGLARLHLPEAGDDPFGIGFRYRLMTITVLYLKGPRWEASWNLDTLLASPEGEDPAYGELFTAAREFRLRMPDYKK